jgi:hypothetical protein
MTFKNNIRNAHDYDSMKRRFHASGSGNCFGDLRLFWQFSHINFIGRKDV